MVIANCETAAAGFGIAPEIADELLDQGAHCLTSGNHIWKHRTIYPYIEEQPRLLRPANFPEGTPGNGWCVVNTAQGPAAVINLMGTARMEPLECPFRTFDHLYHDARRETPVVIVDFHADSTSEKGAFGAYADGRASLVFGTHTHVQTADEKILPGGTGFITDIGMTGPEDSILGVSKEIVVEKFLSRMPVRFEIASGTALMCGVLAEIDLATGKTVRISRVQERAL